MYTRQTEATNRCLIKIYFSLITISILNLKSTNSIAREEGITRNVKNIDYTPVSPNNSIFFHKKIDFLDIYIFFLNFSNCIHPKKEK